MSETWILETAMARSDDKKFDTNAIVQTCELCGNGYQFGPHIYDGTFISSYKLWVCMSCFNGNYDGWNNRHNKKLEAHWSSHDIKFPKRNSKGFYPRGG